MLFLTMSKFLSVFKTSVHEQILKYVHITSDHVEIVTYHIHITSDHEEIVTYHVRITSDHEKILTCLYNF